MHNISLFLTAIRARRRWSGHLGFSLAPDSNIGAGSEERFIHIRHPLTGQTVPLQRDQKDLTSSGVGISVWASGEYQHPLGEKWRLRAGGEVSRREYRKGEFDQMAISAHLGPRWLAGPNSEASMLASVRRQWTGNDPAHRDVGVRLEFSRRINERTTANANFSRHERRYHKGSTFDGPVTDVSLGASWVATPTVRLESALGYGRVRAEVQCWRHASRWLRAGVTTALPRGYTVGASGTLRWARFEGACFPGTTDNRSRRDLTRSLRLTAHHRAFAVKGFSPQISLIRERRNTNAQAYDYKRTYGELRFVRLF